LGAGITRAEGGSCVKLTGAATSHAVSSSPLSKSCLWRAEMHGFDNSLYLGIIEKAARLESYDRVSYGWAGQWVFQAGVASITEGFLGFRSGDLALFRLDMEGSRLQMAHKRLNKVFSIDLPKEQKTWHVHISLGEVGTKVTLCSLQLQHLTCPAYAWAAELGFGK
jgi:hypothetical protein